MYLIYLFFTNIKEFSQLYYKNQSMLTCQVCLLPLDECRENDKKLIKPFDERFKNQTSYHADNESRITRVYRYLTGAYDQNINRGYLTTRYLNFRQQDDVFLTMPLCVYEGNYVNLFRKIKWIVLENVHELPIIHNHKRLLTTLLTDGIEAYVSSLPPPPRPMPRKRHKTHSTV